METEKQSTNTALKLYWEIYDKYIRSITITDKQIKNNCGMAKLTYWHEHVKNE